MKCTDIALDIEQIDSKLKEYKERRSNVDCFPNLKLHLRQRDNHSHYLKSVSSEDISKMSKEELENYFDRKHIWSDQRRATAHYMIEDNGYQKVKEYFVKIYSITENNVMLDSDLWDYFVDTLKNAGKGWLTELLSALDRNNYVLYNKSTIDGLKNFGLNKISTDCFDSYQRILKACRIISKEMERIGFEDSSLYEVDGFLNYLDTCYSADSEVNYWYYASGDGSSEWENDIDEGSMSIGWNDIGDLSEYQTKRDMLASMISKNAGKRTNSPWYFTHVMKPGDIVFVRRGRHSVIGVGKVLGPYQHDGDREPFCNYRKVEWTVLDSQIETNHKTSMDTISLVPNEESVKYLLQKCNGIQDNDIVPEISSPTSYSVEDLLNETFLSNDEFDKMQYILLRKKNLILKGAPGVGKTYLARRIAYAMIGNKSNDNIEFIQFHQNYSYEEFIIGYKPIDDGFELKPGVFYEFCEKARKDRENKFFFIIDEINRGNLSKIFGEMLVLIESDKREGSVDGLTLKTSYGGGEYKFSIPDNVYIIGMMNTADRGLAIIDYALRRRFAFFTLVPKFNDPEFPERLQMESSISPELATRICSNMNRVNDEIERTLGPGYTIGHSFFIRSVDDDIDLESDENEWYEEIIEFEIRPLLEEYYFDDQSTVDNLMSILNS